MGMPTDSGSYSPVLGPGAHQSGMLRITEEHHADALAL
jgi:hypothetical protein